MNIIWIKIRLSEWLGINIDEIKTFSYDSKYETAKSLFINNKFIARDDELILFKALEQFLTNSGDKYALDIDIELYNNSVKRK